MGAEGAESWHTMLVTAHGWAREAPGASGPQAALRASNATGGLAAGPLKTCRTFLGPSSSALSSTLQSRPWEVQGASPSVLCALPTQLHVPSFKVTSKRVLELPLVCHLSRPREGQRVPLFPGLLVTWLYCSQAAGGRGRARGRQGESRNKSKRENHRFTSQQRDLPAGSTAGRGLGRSFGLPPGWACGSEAGTLAAAP